MSLSDSCSREIDRLLFEGNPIRAITEYRASTGAGLSEAKNFVDDRLERLLVCRPEEFRPPPKPEAFDAEVLRQIRFSREIDLKPLRGCLRQIQALVAGLNYEVTLRVKAVDFPGETLPRAEAIKALYPETEPRDELFFPSTWQEMSSAVEERLCFEGDEGAGPQFDESRLQGLSAEKIPALWRHLDMVKSANPEIHAYGESKGLPGYDTFWFFGYLLRPRRHSHCLVFTGLASD